MLMCLKLRKIYQLAVLIAVSSLNYAYGAEKPVISKQLILKASKERVWKSLTDPTELEKWWNKGVKIDPIVGGQFYEPWGKDQLATGKVIRLSPLKFIEFSWREKSWKKFEKTICSFILKESYNSITLTVKHTGWEVFADPVKVRQLVEGFNQGWNTLLLKFKRHINPNP